MVLMVFFSSRISPRTSTVILRRKIAVRDGRGHFGDVADLVGQVAGHGVHANPSDLSSTPPTPRTSAWPPSLPSVPTSRATRVTSEANELSWSTMVLMVFFSSRISPRTSTVILRRKIAVRDGRGHFGDVTNLSGQVAGHGIHGVGQIFPDTRHALHFRLAAELAFRADFARHARHFRSEGAELIDHRVDGVLQLQNFAARVHRDLAW